MTTKRPPTHGWRRTLSFALLSASAVLVCAIDAGHGANPLTIRKAEGVDRCTRDSRPFQGSVVLTHVLTVDSGTEDLGQITETDLLLLGDLFVRTYNNEQQGERYCDPHFRRLSAVSIRPVRYTQEDLGTLLLPSVDEHKTATVALPIRYDVEGYCEGCTEELFDTAATIDAPLVKQPTRGLRWRGKTRVTKLKDTGRQMGLESTGSRKHGSTECACQSSAAKLSGPTKEELLQALNHAIAQPHSPIPSRLKAIQSIDPHAAEMSLGRLHVGQRRTQDSEGLIDVVEFTCEKPAQQLDVTVFLRVPVSAVVEANEMAQLEESFLVAYNNLTFALCDFPHFRKITSVTAALVEQGQSFVPEQERLDSIWSTSAAFSQAPAEETRIVAVQVKTDCHQCNATTLLFHPTPRLIMQDSPNALATIGFGWPMGGATSTRQATSCVCSQNGHANNVFRAPTAEEFRMQFNTYHSIAGVTHDQLLLQVEEEQRLVEAQVVSCGDDPDVKIFTTTVLADLSLDPLTLNEEAKLLLEDTFKSVYNVSVESQPPNELV
jgi:hypothetical protein